MPGDSLIFEITRPSSRSMRQAFSSRIDPGLSGRLRVRMMGALGDEDKSIFI